MRSVDFQLEPSTLTPFGGACADYLQAPGCGFLCGSMSFSCEFVHLSEARTKMHWQVCKWPKIFHKMEINLNFPTNQITVLLMNQHFM